MQHEIQKFGELIQNSQKILLINHIRMDGDAWGSLAALAGILEKLGKTVKAINDCSVPPGLTLFGTPEIVDPNLDVGNYNPDIIISLDASDTNRLGKIYETWKVFFQKVPLIVIDHHISNPGFGDINIIDINATSTCELLTEILQTLKLDIHIDTEISTLLYLGLQTDTNMYFNSDVSAKTLQIGAFLIERGADFRKVIYENFQKKSLMQLKIWEKLLKNLKQEENGKISYSYISRENIKELGIPREEIGGYLKGAINELLINIEGTEIAFLLYPLDPEENKVSMRAQPGNNVAKICEGFGGGGHILAAGFQSFESEEVIISQVLQKIKEAF